MVLDFIPAPVLDVMTLIFGLGVLLFCVKIALGRPGRTTPKLFLIVGVAFLMMSSFQILWFSSEGDAYLYGVVISDIIFSVAFSFAVIRMLHREDRKPKNWFLLIYMIPIIAYLIRPDTSLTLLQIIFANFVIWTVSFASLMLFSNRVPRIFSAFGAAAGVAGIANSVIVLAKSFPLVLIESGSILFLPITILVFIGFYGLYRTSIKNPDGMLHGHDEKIFKHHDKIISDFSFFMISALALAGFLSFFMLTVYQPPKIFEFGELLEQNKIQATIDSLTVADRVVGTSTGILAGNQTALSAEKSKFVILKITMINNEDFIKPTLLIKNMLLETKDKRTYEGQTIEEILRERIRKVATQDEINRYYCPNFPLEIEQNKSVIGCIIFHIPGDKVPQKFVYTNSQGNIVFAINLGEN